MKRANIIFGIIAIIIAGFVFNQLASFPDAQPDEVGADFFPRLLAIGLGLSGIVLIINTLVSKNPETDEGPSFNLKSLLRAFISLIAVLVYCLSLDLFGFIASSILFLTFMMFLLQERNIIKIMTISAVITASVFVIFSEFLLIDLPLGTLYGF